MGSHLRGVQPDRTTPTRIRLILRYHIETLPA
jgi:hypothetical protein